MSRPASAPSEFSGRPARDNLLRRLFVNAAILVAGKGVNAAFSLAYLALAARTLGIEALGFLILIHTYAQAVGEIGRFQSSEAVLRYGAPALHDHRVGDFQALLKFTALLDIASGIAAAGLAALGCRFIAPLIGVPAELVPIANAYCVSIVFMATATPTGLLRLFDRFDLLAVHSAVASLIRLLGAAVLFTLGGGVVEFLIVWFAATACASATLVGFAWRETMHRRLLAGVNWSFHRVTAPFAGIGRFVWATQLNTSIAMLSTHLATLLAGGLLGATEAALYRIARELAEAVAKPTKLLIPALYPELARLTASGSIRRMQNLVTRSLVAAGVAAAGSFLLIWLTGDFLLRLVAGETAVPAHALMILLGAASLLALGTFPLEPLLVSVGREGAALRARLVATLLYVPLVVVMVQASGLIGAGVAAIAASLLLVGGQLIPVIRWFSRQRSTPEATATG